MVMGFGEQKLIKSDRQRAVSRIESFINRFEAIYCEKQNSRELRCGKY